MWEHKRGRSTSLCFKRIRLTIKQLNTRNPKHKCQKSTLSLYLNLAEFITAFPLKPQVCNLDYGSTLATVTPAINALIASLESNRTISPNPLLPSAGHGKRVKESEENLFNCTRFRFLSLWVSAVLPWILQTHYQKLIPLLLASWT